MTPIQYANSQFRFIFGLYTLRRNDSKLRAFKQACFAWVRSYRYLKGV